MRRAAQGTCSPLLSCMFHSRKCCCSEHMHMWILQQPLDFAMSPQELASLLFRFLRLTAGIPCPLLLASYCTLTSFAKLVSLILGTPLSLREGNSLWGLPIRGWSPIIINNNHLQESQSEENDGTHVSKADTNSWLQASLPELLSCFKPENVYNIDETGLFFRLRPDHTFEFAGKWFSGGKKSKDRWTALVGGSMVGEKLLLLVIGTSKNPRCFKGVWHLPLDHTDIKVKPGWMANCSRITCASGITSWWGSVDAWLRTIAQLTLRTGNSQTSV